MSDDGMTRRELLGYVAGGGAVLSTGAVLGSQADLGGGSGQAQAAGNESTATPAETATSTATPAFDPDVTFPTCSSFEVTADAYGPVLASLSDGSTTEFDGDYAGTESFETAAVVESVLVYGPDGGQASADNPAAGSCSATATEASTDTPTETPTETATETPTETETETATESPTPTATPEPEEGVSVEFTQADTGQSDIFDFDVENNNSYSVRVTVKVEWEWSDGKITEDSETDELGPFANWSGTLGTKHRDDAAIREWNGSLPTVEKI